VELVPKTSWYHNVRALVDELGWDRIRRQEWRQAEYRCQLCGGKGPERPVECHQVWGAVNQRACPIEQAPTSST
jgi:hypothetical protein